MKNVNAMLEVVSLGAKLKRWNGIYKSEDFLETNKQGLNASIAFLLAKMYENETGEKVNYLSLIELSICRMVYKTIFTDMNPNISYSLFFPLKSEVDKYAMAKVKVMGFDEAFCEMFESYLKCKDSNSNIELQIFHAASKLATEWEFNQIKSGAGQNYSILRIESDIKEKLKSITSLGVVKEYMLDDNLKNFVDLYANTAFLKRWTKYEMNPQSSDLSHMYMTAVVTYLMMTTVKMSEERCIEGFYAGLFHDTIEILTGDLPHTLKKEVPGLKARLTKIEEEKYKEHIATLLPKYLNDSMKRYILMTINEDDRKIVKAADNISAYVERINSLLVGTTEEYFAKSIIKERDENRDFELEGIQIKEVYEHFYKKYLNYVM